MVKYPIFLDLTDRRVVLIGGGAVTVRKVGVLLETGARLVVVANRADDVLTGLCAERGVELVRAKYAKEYIAEAALVIAATNDEKVNRQIHSDCQELGILCNVVDNPPLCDFFIPAVVRRGDLQIAIGTDGYCPAYAGHLRKKLEAIFTEQHGLFLTELEWARKRIIEAIDDPADRKVLLGELVDDESFDYFTANGSDAWRERAGRRIGSHQTES